MVYGPVTRKSAFYFGLCVCLFVERSVAADEWLGRSHFWVINSTLHGAGISPIDVNRDRRLIALRIF